MGPILFTLYTQPLLGVVCLSRCGGLLLEVVCPSRCGGPLLGVVCPSRCGGPLLGVVCLSRCGGHHKVADNAQLHQSSAPSLISISDC